MKRALTIIAVMLAGMAQSNQAQWAAFDDHYFTARVAADSWTPISGLIAHYKMNDNAASTLVLDSVGTNNGVAPDNTSVISGVGKINGALQLSGADSYYINIPTSPQLNFGGKELSIAIWAKIQNAIGAGPSDLNNAGIVYRGSAANSQGTVSLAFFTGGTSYALKPGMRMNGSTSEGSGQVTCTNAIPTNAWHHIVFTYDGTNQSFFINGVAENSRAYSTSLSTDNNSWKIGIYYGAAHTLEALVDDVRIYKRALTMGEITRIYNNGNGTENE